jgi:hypothetical protein
VTPLATQAAAVTTQFANTSELRIRSGLTGETPDWMQNKSPAWPNSQPHYRLANAVVGAVSYTANALNTANALK